MHILLANDDGIGTVGIMALLDTAVRRGHTVTMCAPNGQMSASSQRITLSEPIITREYPTKYPNCKAYAINGTPADCVRVALCPGGLVTEKVDLAISGINNGHNGGTAVFYSGTVGAAREASLMRVPAIAASILFGAEPEQVHDLAEFVLEVGEKYANVAPSERGAILNINGPCLLRKEWAGVQYAPLSCSHFTDSYEARYHPRAGAYFWLDSSDDTEPPERGSDLWYLDHGFVTLTLVSNPDSATEECFREMNLLG